MTTKKDLVSEALAKVSEIGVVAAMQWLADSMDFLYRPRSGSAGAYHNGSPEARAMIDSAIERADAMLALSPRNRGDRRKVNMPWAASGIHDRRQAERRGIGAALRNNPDIKYKDDPGTDEIIK